MLKSDRLKQIRMSTRIEQQYKLVILLTPNQEPIRLDMTLPHVII